MMMNNGDAVDDDLSMMLMALKTANIKKKETTIEAKREELRELLRLLEERLAQHDENRREVQRELKDTCAKIVNDTDSTEDQTGGEIRRDFEKKEEGILELIEKLRRRRTAGEGYGDLKGPIKEALTTEYRYEIRRYCFVDSYELVATPVKSKTAEGICLNYATDSIETIIGMLERHLDKMRKSMNSAYEKLGGICGGRRQTAEELDEGVNRELEESFTTEDARLQRVVNLVREGISSESGEELETLCKRARATLLLIQKYSLNSNINNINNNKNNNKKNLIITQEASLESIEFEKRQPADIAVTFPGKGLISLSFAFFNDLELKAFESLGNPHNVIVSAWMEGMGEDAGATITKEYTPWACDGIRFSELLSPKTTYCLKVRLEYNGSYTRWSEETEFVTPEFDKLCAWKECPDYVDEKSSYCVGKDNPGIATMIGRGDHTVIGNAFIPSNTVTSWTIKILKSEKNDGEFIYIGVAPFDINQNNNSNYDSYGWYFDCYWSVLYSGPPHNYRWKAYGPRKKEGQYVHTGDSVGVVVDTIKGELSFALNNVNYGVAFEGIPLDKPLVPCVVLGYKDDSVELDTSEVKETVVDSSIPVPLNFVVNNRTSWDTIILTWDNISDVSFYQVEVDGSKTWDTSTTNSFTKKDFLPDTEHSFRVRTVRGSSVSEWSDVIKGRTLKAPEFSECVWKKCPDYVDDKWKYSVDEKNPRIATKVNCYDDDGYAGRCSTIIGSTHIPLNKVTSWGVKILKSKDNDGGGIFIGIAPKNIIQDSNNNYHQCGWYFHCFSSTLYSGPPHNYYSGKEYGPRKWRGQYVHTGDSVGVVMDTTKGELSFVLDGVNLGVAFEGIPLDKPLVPCVLFNCKDDSIELMI